jgi:hypothetical protein
VLEAAAQLDRAIAWLEALPKSARRDELLRRTLERAGRIDESAAARRATLSPSQLAAEGLSEEQIVTIALARKKFSTDEEGAWLAFAVKQAASTALEHVAARAHPSAILAALPDATPQARREFAWIAVERLFKANVPWLDEARAKRCVRSATAQLITNALDERDRAKLVAKARKLAERVEGTSHDWFTRQLAIELIAALDDDKTSQPPPESL